MRFASGAGRVGTLGAVLLSSTALILVAGIHGRASAQSQQSGITFQDLGAQAITGTDWSFSGDYQVGAGAWESVTISNYGYCFVGPNDPRAGTAHAAAVYWFAELQSSPPDATGYSFTGDLKPGRGGNAAGRVTVTLQPGSSPITHIQATISGSDLSYYLENSLRVCLLGSS